MIHGSQTTSVKWTIKNCLTVVFPLMFLNSISIERNTLTLFERVSLRIFVCLRICHECVIYFKGCHVRHQNGPAFQYDKIRPFILPQTNKAIAAENTLFKF